jgi:phosphonate transport system substrate-binding protein
MIRRGFTRMALAVMAGLGLLASPAAQAQDWKAQVKELRIGLLGGENTQSRLARYDGFQRLLQARLGIPIKLFPAADYAGVMQAMGAGQLDLSEFSPSAFAGAWLDCKCIDPVVVPLERDGTVYYVAVMITRKDSGITSIEQMKGHSLTWADPNSASGYLIPKESLRRAGIDLADGAYFSRTGFAGGHEQGIVAVLNKQYDACVTWTSGQGDITQGYSRGTLRGMVDRGMLKMSTTRSSRGPESVTCRRRWSCTRTLSNCVKPNAAATAADGVSGLNPTSDPADVSVAEHVARSLLDYRGRAMGANLGREAWVFRLCHGRRSTPLEGRWRLATHDLASPSSVSRGWPGQVQP